MNKSARNQDIRSALLELLLGQIKSSPRLDVFKRFTHEPVKLPGMAKLTVPESVWHSLLDEPELAAFALSIDHDSGTSPELTMQRR